jgi:apolipoprotein D and lipocalin family protein
MSTRLFVCFLLAAFLHRSHAAVLAPDVASASNICVNAPPAANFSTSAYEGTWFEIAKYQTAGGAFFERNCVCTQVEVQPLPAPSPDLSALFSCRDKLPSGKYLNATGRLYDEGPPGKWMQKLRAFVPPVSYTIVAMGEWQGEE